MQAVVVVGKIASGKEQAVKLLKELTGAPVYAGSAIIKSEIILEHVRERMRAISQRRSIRPLREHSSITREEYREAYLQRAERFGKDWAAREIVRRHFFRNSCQEIIVEGPRDLPDVKCLVKDGGVVVELKVKDQLRFERKCARAESRDKNLATFRDFMEFEREEAACLDAAINWARSNNGRGGVEFVEVPNEAEGTENLRRALIELVFPRLKAAGWNLPVKN